MRISVVTPTLNMAKQLPACLESVRRQSHTDVEHIVIDGGSIDGTVELLRDRAGVRWVSEPDRGQSDAINKGLRLATGDVLGWLNADDELAPGALDRVVAALRREPGAGLVYGDLEFVDVDGRVRIDRPGEFSVTGMWRGNVLSQPGTFWTRTTQDAVGLLDESFHLTMDFEYWLRMAHAGVRGVYIPEVQARFVVHADSKTGSEDRFRFIEEEARALRTYGEHHGAAMAIDRWFWWKVVRDVGEAAIAGRRSEAAAAAAAALPRMTPLRSKTRWFLYLARTWPWLAAKLYERRLRRSAPW